MYKGKRVLGVIPVDFFNCKIKNLSIYPIYNKPLFLLTAEEAKKSEYIDTICISTDSIKYALIAEQNGFFTSFIRPENLNLIETIVHARNFYKDKCDIYDCIVILNINSPLRTKKEIDEAIETYFELNIDSLVSVTDCEVCPQFIRIMNDSKLTSILNYSSEYKKELFPKYYRVNESIYINNFTNINLNTILNNNSYGYYIDCDKSILIEKQEDIKKVRSAIKSQKVTEYFEKIRGKKNV
ncbi:MAG: hypothetical protein E7172_04865 [Firmicutes bacterium]|nr:hypothetical protein [Bacillota bacterium]